ncbi:MAG: hypothetical protein ACJAUP_000440 [Cellvibrionaceae bacterium]|jgi:hypothetical protein
MTDRIAALIIISKNPNHLPTILKRFTIEPETWLQNSTEFDARYWKICNNTKRTCSFYADAHRHISSVDYKQRKSKQTTHLA